MLLKRGVSGWACRVAVLCTVVTMLVAPLHAQSAQELAERGEATVDEAVVLEGKLLQADFGAVTWVRWNHDASEINVSLPLLDDGWRLQLWAMSPEQPARKRLLDAPRVVAGQPTTAYLPVLREGRLVTMVLVRDDETVDPQTIASWEIRVRAQDAPQRGSVYTDVQPGGSFTIWTCQNSSCTLVITWKEPLPPGYESNPTEIELDNGDSFAVNMDLTVTVRCNCN